MPWRTINAFEKALLDSISAAACEGPNALIPRPATRRKVPQRAELLDR